MFFLDEMAKLRKYKVYVDAWRYEAVMLFDKPDDTRHYAEMLVEYAQLEEKIEALMKLAYDYIQAYEKLAFGDNPLIGGDDETE